MSIDPRLVALGLAAPEPAAAAQALTAPPGAEPLARAVPVSAPLRSAPVSAPVVAAPVATTPVPPAQPARPRPAAQPVAEAAPALPPRTNGITVPVFRGFPARSGVLTFDNVGLHVTGKEPFGVPWTQIAALLVRRNQLVIRTAARAVVISVAIDGVMEPALARPLARVLEEARGGSLDRSGSAFLEFRNATDRLRDAFADEDDTFTPAVVGLVFLACVATAVMLVPHVVALGTAPAVPAGMYVLDSRLSPLDPRSLTIALAAAALLTSLMVRIAGGRHALAWARGTLRGWHRGREVTGAARRALATIVHRPAIAAAVLLLGVTLSLPSARTVVVFGDHGVRLVREMPFLDDERPWGAVAEITAIPAPLDRHPSGVAVVVRFVDGASITTLGNYLQGGTDKQLFDMARGWRDSATAGGD